MVKKLTKFSKILKGNSFELFLRKRDPTKPVKKGTLKNPSEKSFI